VVSELAKPADKARPRADLIARGVDAGEVFHCTTSFGCRFQGRSGRASGPHPERLSYGSYLSFCDPDGNSWQFQEVTTRRPGRISGDTTYTSAYDLSQALRRAAAKPGEHEKRTGQADPNWADWYAEYLVREQKGDALPE